MMALNSIMLQTGKNERTSWLECEASWVGQSQTRAMTKSRAARRNCLVAPLRVLPTFGRAWRGGGGSQDTQAVRAN